MTTPLTPAKESKRQELAESIKTAVDAFLALPQIDGETDCDINVADSDVDKINAIAIQLARHRYGRGTWPMAITITNALKYEYYSYRKVRHESAVVSDTDAIERIDAIETNAKTAINDLIAAFLTPVRDQLHGKLEQELRAVTERNAAIAAEKAAARLLRRPTPAVGKYADAHEVLPASSAGINHGIHRIVLVRRGKKMLLWLPGHTSSSRRSGYVQSEWRLYPHGQHSIGKTLFEGGRLSATRLGPHAQALVDYFGIKFSLRDVREDSTLILPD